MRIGIIAALPGELKPLVKSWRAERTSNSLTKRWSLQRDGDIWIATCAGMGAEAARRAFAAAESDGPLDMVLSVGWVGALDAGLAAGSVHVPTVVIDAQTGEQFSLAQNDHRRKLVTTAHVADAAEKMRLAETYSVSLVDMEAATVARLAEMRKISLLCIKGVSDEAGAELPDLNPFIDEQGQMRMVSFLAHVALRPRYWTSLMHLGRNSARAAEAMRDLIVEFMKEKNVEKLIATGNL